MLIERMNSHPEDFRLSGRLRDFTSRSYDMSQRDRVAITAAFGELILEPKMMEDILTTLQAPEENKSPFGTSQSNGVYQSGHGFADPRAVYNSVYGQQAAAQQQLQNHQMNAELVRQMVGSPVGPGGYTIANNAARNTTLDLDGEKLTSGMLGQIKQKLGIT